MLDHGPAIVLYPQRPGGHDTTRHYFTVMVGLCARYAHLNAHRNRERSNIPASVSGASRPRSGITGELFSVSGCG